MEFKSFKQDDERKVLQLKVFFDIFQKIQCFFLKDELILKDKELQRSKNLNK